MSSHDYSGSAAAAVLRKRSTSKSFTKNFKLLLLSKSRHAAHQAWNHTAVRKHARESLRVVLQCNALLRSLSRGKRSIFHSDMHSPLVVRKVMVTQNVETDLYITNSARGTVVDIVLHPHEPPLTLTNGVVHLNHLPLFLFVKFHRTRSSPLAGLDPSVIPVEAVTKSYRIQHRSADGAEVTRTIRRRQFPMMAAYAFMDYHLQGQTIPHVIVDIAGPPTGGLNLFNLYVALSRSSGRETIRLLRDFGPWLRGWHIK